ncbi:ribonuclease H-like domain-containing protein [Mycena maculata]|uniref:Ribonuclease H n=1 Tax=Mycena maculata TaxID=230809 RepID=A0AAD7J1G0_9AGAR|nr:ribonuclease H-like domain-containing protein [Mycena maculata]
MAAYAVKVGKQTGIYATWPECEAQVKGFAGAKYKKFKNYNEAAEWVAGVAGAASPVKPSEAASAFGSKGKKRMMFPDVKDESGWDIVYSDGACKGNGQVGSVAGVGVWWGRDDPRNIAERCPGDQTNNRAELIAILRILETTPPSERPLLIKSDSRYSISCFQDWLPKWQKNNFISSTGEPVKNAPIIRYLAAHLDARARRGQQIRLQYVKAHNGEEGNEGADAQANLGAFKPFEPERNWAQLEAKLRQNLETELQSSPLKPEPVLLEVVDEQEGFATQEPEESPSKMRKTSASSDKPKSRSTEPSKPASRPAAPQVPLYLTPSNVVQSSTTFSVQIAPEDWAQYADGLVDDDDLLADLSD